jgi:arginyl-tRNA synthetase
MDMKQDQSTADLSLAEQIRKATTEALLEVGANEVKFAVEWPTDMANGDYATNAAMAAAKSMSKNPHELAIELVPLIAQKLSKATASGNFATSIEVAGPGFINITLSPETIASHIEHALAAGKEWGTTSENNDKRIIIEFSCPNPFKEMHIGHLMSTIIGESIARLTESSGATVARDTYGGDVGPHVAKALWALQKTGVTEPTSAEEIGKAYAHGSRAYEESEEAKAEIDALNTEIYKGDDHALMELWRKGREISLEAFRDLYRLLDTHFDYYFFESETSPLGMKIVQDGLEKGVFEESDGAIIYNGENKHPEKNLHTLVFITSRGTPTYEAKDMGLAFLKEDRYPSDQSLIITAAEQVGHFKVFLAALGDIAPQLAAKTHHVPHGFLRLSTGKMSSRDGNVITAQSLIRDVIEKTLEHNADPLIAEQVAMGAIKFSILRSSAGSDIIFDFDSSLSLEGESGPYLQYATVRAKSILANAVQNLIGREENLNEDKNVKLFAAVVPFAIERLIIRFPEVVIAAQRNLAPHTVAQYLTQLAREWNSFYAQERIIGSEDETHKLEIARAFVTTMENGLHLLGITVPERM